jgi:hypothetical protein
MQRASQMCIDVKNLSDWSCIVHTVARGMNRCVCQESLYQRRRPMLHLPGSSGIWRADCEPNSHSGT